MYKFLLIDDHSMIRAGMQVLLSGEYPKSSFDEASNEKQSYKFLLEGTYHLILLDINMPDTDPFRLLQFIKKNQPTTPVLVLTMNDELSFASRLFKLGISGYVNKSADNNTIIKAVRTVLDKGIYMSDALKESLLATFVTNKGENPFESLSEREFQVVRELLLGRSIAEISESLGINVSTVSTYKGKAFEKLGISKNNVMELVSLARVYGIV